MDTLSIVIPAFGLIIMFGICMMLPDISTGYYDFDYPEKLTKYDIDLINRKTITIEAKTPEAALDIAQARYPEFKVDYITDNNWFSESPAVCDDCGKYLFLGQVAAYEEDNDNSYCTECAKEAEFPKNTDDEHLDYTIAAVVTQGIYDSIGEELSLLDAEQIVTAVKFLREQGHSAESIACHLQLRGLFHGYVPHLAAALIENGICKQ